MIRALQRSQKLAEKRLIIFTDLATIGSYIERFKTRVITAKTEKFLITNDVYLDLLCNLSQRSVHFYFVKSKKGGNIFAHKFANSGAQNSIHL